MKIFLVDQLFFVKKTFENTKNILSKIIFSRSNEVTISLFQQSKFPKKRKKSIFFCSIKKGKSSEIPKGFIYLIQILAILKVKRIRVIE